MVLGACASIKLQLVSFVDWKCRRTLFPQYFPIEQEQQNSGKPEDLQITELEAKEMYSLSHGAAILIWETSRKANKLCNNFFFII